MDRFVVEIMGCCVDGDYPNWVIDMPDIWRLENNGYTKEKDR